MFLLKAVSINADHVEYLAAFFFPHLFHHDNYLVSKHMLSFS